MTEIVVTDITTSQVDGSGVFDELMTVTRLHLDEQYTQNRIKGSDYASVYLGSVQSVMQQSISYLLGRQQAAAQAELTEAQIITQGKQDLLLDAQILKLDAETGNVLAERDNIDKKGLLLIEQVLKLQQDIRLGEKQELLIDSQILKSGAEVAILQQDILKGIEEILVLKQDVLKSAAEVSMLGKQEDLVDSQILKSAEEILVLKQEVLKSAEEVLVMKQQVIKSVAEISMLGKQEDKLDVDITNAAYEGTLTQNQGDKVAAEENLAKQKLMTEIAGIKDSFNYTDAITGVVTPSFEPTGLLGKQIGKIDQELVLLSSKVNTEDAQTKDVVDGSGVTGVVGKQKGLYGAQTNGFARDAEQKLAKIMADTWNVAKTADPTGVSGNASNRLSDSDIGQVIDSAKKGIGII